MQPNVRPHRRIRALFSVHATGQALSPQLSSILRGIALLLICYLFTARPLLFSVNPLALATVAALQDGIGWGVLGIALGLWQTGEAVVLHGVAVLLTLLVRLVLGLFVLPKNPEEARDLRARWLGRVRVHLLWLVHLGRPTDGQDTPSPPDPLLLDEPTHWRVLAALIGGLVPALGIPLSHGFPFYDLVGSVLYLVLLAPATVLLRYALDRTDESDTLARPIGLSLLLCAICFCGRTVTLLGISPVVCLVVILTLAATARHGFGMGVVCGVLGGICYAPLTVPIYLCISISHALLSPLFGAASLLPSAGIALVVTLLLGGTPTLRTLAPSLAVGMLIYTAGRRLVRHGESAGKDRAVKSHKQHELMTRLLAEETAIAASRARISDISSAFGALSETARSQSARPTLPDADELRAVLDGVMDEHCPHCPHRTRCWSEEYTTTAEGVREVGRRLANRPEDTEWSFEAFSAAMRSRCSSMSDIMDKTRYRAAHLPSIRQTAARAELLADTYDTIAHLLRDTLHECGPEHDARCTRDDLAEMVASWLDDHEIHVRHVLVTGDRILCIRIFGISPAALAATRDELQSSLSRCCAVPLSRPRYDGSDDGTLTLCAEPRYRISCSHVCHAADTSSETARGRAVCGDTLRTLQTDHGLFYALLCDGMGSGRQASQTSNMAAMLLERLLGAGVSIGTALRLVNHFLRSRTDRPEHECSSTVDLLEMDVYTGQARLIKSGAAPSLILRGGRVFRLTAHTVPLGILGTVDAQTTALELSDGDRILLMSDGVTDTAVSETCTDDWLSDYLSGDIPEEDGVLAERLIDLARTHGSSDDASVAVVRIGTADS